MKRSEDPGWREQAALDLKDQLPNSSPSLFNKKEASKVPGRREQVHKMFSQPQRLYFQVKDRHFQLKNQSIKKEIKLKDFIFVHL